MKDTDSQLVQNLRQTVIPIAQDNESFTELLDLIGDSRVVLLGEATHGTHEFYNARIHITRELIEKKNFAAVALEAEWPGAFRVNRYVRHISNDKNAEESLSDFKQFPIWMWRNREIVNFVDYLHRYNESLPQQERIGFYGLDLYSLFTSIDAVINTFEKIDPELAEQARQRYSCLERFGQDAETYGASTAWNLEQNCQKKVIEQLIAIRNKKQQIIKSGGFLLEEEYFFAEQNALLTKNAEQYYRALFSGIYSTWNIRDQHMADTASRLIDHISEKKEKKLIIWAHNSHIGNASATEFAVNREISLGQLIKRKFAEKSFLLGFTTDHGQVAAAKSWGADVENIDLNPALPGSYEDLFHKTEVMNFLLPLEYLPEELESLRQPRLQRGIGVIYIPESERQSHYFHAKLPDQFDAVIHYDRTNAVSPLETKSPWPEKQLAETYDTGL